MSEENPSSDQQFAASAEGARSGPRWLAPVAIGLGLVGTALLWVAYALRPPSPDLATFDYVAWVCTNGGTLYVDVIEQNWPGAVWFHSLAARLFGTHGWSFRALDFGIACLGALSLASLLRRAGHRTAAWVVVPLYECMYASSNLWFAGQRDVLGTHLFLIACVAYVRRIDGGRRLYVVPMGIVAAVLMLMRPTYVLLPAFVVLVDLALGRSERRTTKTVIADTLAWAGVSFAVLAITVAVGIRTGGLRGWYEAAVLFNAQLYSRTATLARLTRVIVGLAPSGWHWYMAFAALGAFVWWRTRERLILSLVTSLFLTGLVSYYVQGKGFGYHLGAWLPAFGAFGAVLLGSSLDLALRKRTATTLAVALALCGIAVAGSAKKLVGTLGPELGYVVGARSRDAMRRAQDTGVEGFSASDAERAAAFARRHTTRSGTVLTWGRAIYVNVLAQRALSVPFATVGVLDLVRPPFVLEEQWLDGFEQTLERRPPAIVFAPNETMGSSHAQLFVDADAPRASRMLRRALSLRYRRAASFGSFDAYLLVDGSP